MGFKSDEWIEFFPILKEKFIVPMICSKNVFVSFRWRNNLQAELCYFLIRILHRITFQAEIMWVLCFSSLLQCFLALALNCYHGNKDEC